MIKTNKKVYDKHVGKPMTNQQNLRGKLFTCLNVIHLKMNFCSYMCTLIFSYKNFFFILFSFFSFFSLFFLFSLFFFFHSLTGFEINNIERSVLISIIFLDFFTILACIRPYIKCYAFALYHSAFDHLAFSILIFFQNY